LAEGFEGIHEIETDVENLLQDGGLDAGHAALLRSMVDDRRYALEEEMRISSQMDEWSGAESVDSTQAPALGPAADPYAQQFIDQGYSADVAATHAAKYRDHVVQSAYGPPGQPMSQQQQFGQPMIVPTPGVEPDASAPLLTPEQAAHGWTQEMLDQWTASQ